MFQNMYIYIYIYTNIYTRIVDWPEAGHEHKRKMLILMSSFFDKYGCLKRKMDFGKYNSMLLVCFILSFDVLNVFDILV